MRSRNEQLRSKILYWKERLSLGADQEWIWIGDKKREKKTMMAGKIWPKLKIGTNKTSSWFYTIGLFFLALYHWFVQGLIWPLPQTHTHTHTQRHVTSAVQLQFHKEHFIYVHMLQLTRARKHRHFFSDEGIGTVGSLCFLLFLNVMKPPQKSNILPLRIVYSLD